jgi:hypothetical protein
MKKIFNFFLFLTSSSIAASPITEIFIIESIDSNTSTHMMAIEKQKLRIINDLAYLSIIDDRSYQDCWSEFKVNRGTISYKVSQVEVNIISTNNNSITYELTFDTDSIIFPKDLRKKFKSFCIKISGQ